MTLENWSLWFGSEGSGLGFLSSGLAMTIFSECGKMPSLRLIVEVMTRERISVHCLKSQVGTGSRVHFLLDADVSDW